MSGHVLRLHLHLVNARVLVAMLDGLVRHRQVLVDGPKAVPQVHLVLGAAGVALTKEEGAFSHFRHSIAWEQEPKTDNPTLSWWTMNVMSSPGATANI